MASPDVDIGTGITIVFGTTGFSAEILDVTPPAWSRESVDTTHQGTTTARTFTPVDLYDGGEFSFEHHYQPDDTPPMTTVAEEITLTFPEGATQVFDGFMTSYEPAVPLEDKMTCTSTVKVTGDIEITGA